MSREILFKAKRKNWRELPKKEWWIEGNLITDEMDADVAYIGYVLGSENGVIHDIDVVQIAPETLCQYTGLTDKNGKRIWENDIISVVHKRYPKVDLIEIYPLLPEAEVYKRNYRVEFINTGSNYGYRARNKSIHFMIKGNVIYNHKAEVIGNIFDNPELLE